jgi:hypothetical protein
LKPCRCAIGRPCRDGLSSRGTIKPTTSGHLVSSANPQTA